MQSSKTRKFLIATHGTLATGLKSSLNLIVGAVDNLFLIEAYVDENKALEDEINEVLNQLGDQDELLIFSDILGGSVTNQLLQFALRPNVYIVSGFNLPLVIELILADTDTPLEELIEEAIANAKAQMVFVNKLVAAANNEEHND
jgi:fructoselysine and glucoselysine-specific PTS system IIA component